MLGEWNVLSFWKCIMYTCMCTYVYIYIYIRTYNGRIPPIHTWRTAITCSTSWSSKRVPGDPKLPHWRSMQPMHLVVSHYISLINHLKLVINCMQFYVKSCWKVQHLKLWTSHTSFPIVISQSKGHLLMPSAQCIHCPVKILAATRQRNVIMGHLRPWPIQIPHKKHSFWSANTCQHL